MFRTLQQIILTALFAVFASQASAMFIQPDWLDPTRVGVGVNRYSYSLNDPINLSDPSGNSTASDSAYMSEDVYLDEETSKKRNRLPGHLSRLTRAELNEMYPGAVWEDKKTGFKAAAYKNSKTGEITIAFAGTTDLADAITDGQQYVSGDSPQYGQARDLAKIVSDATHNGRDKLSFTGHSLGGGLALEAALSLPVGAGPWDVNYHRNAKTFNPAGITFKFSEMIPNLRNQLSGANAFIENNVIVGDPVSLINLVTPGTGTPGSTNRFHTGSTPIPGSVLGILNYRPLALHGLDRFSGRLDDGDF